MWDIHAHTISISLSNYPFHSVLHLAFFFKFRSLSLPFSVHTCILPFVLRRQIIYFCTEPSPMLDTSSGQNCEQQHRAARLASHGNYFTAAVVARAANETRQANLAVRKQQLNDEQQLERQAFLRAKQQTQGQLLQTTSQRAVKVADANASAMDAVRAMHNDKLVLYMERESTAMARHPIQQAPETLHLHRAEQRMALQHKYLEATVLQQLARDVQGTHEDVVLEHRQRQLCDQVNRYAASLEEKERILQLGLLAKQRLAEARGTRELARGRARLSHMETELLSTQARQRHQLDTLGFIPHTSSSQSCKAHRGTQLERESVNKVHVTPSLCETYGYLLEQ